MQQMGCDEIRYLAVFTSTVPHLFGCVLAFANCHGPMPMSNEAQLPASAFTAGFALQALLQALLHLQALQQALQTRRTLSILYIKSPRADTYCTRIDAGKRYMRAAPHASHTRHNRTSAQSCMTGYLHKRDQCTAVRNRLGIDQGRSQRSPRGPRSHTHKRRIHATETPDMRAPPDTL